MLAHVPSFGRNPRGSPDFLAYPVPKACMHVLGTRVPRRLGVARSASSPKAAQALGCSLTPGLRISFGRVTCMARAASVPGLWALGFLLLACVCGWVRVAVGRGFCLPLPVVAWGLGWVCLGSVCGVVPLLPAVCGVRGWALVWACFRDLCGFLLVSLAPRRFRFRCAVWAPGSRLCPALLGWVVGLCSLRFFVFFSGCWVSLSRALWSLPRLLSFGGWWLFFFFFSACFGVPFFRWAAVAGLVLPVLAGWSPCACLGVLSLVPSGWGVWPPSVLLVGGLVAVGCFRAPAPPPPFFFFFFSGGGACRAVPPVAFPRLAVALWLVCGVVGPSPLLAEVPVCYSPPLLAGFRCRWLWAVPATPGWGLPAAVVSGVWRWCVGGVVAGVWCGWSLATPGGGSCVLLPATPGWVSLPVVLGGPRHSWLGSVGGVAVWCVVCGGGVLVGLWLVCGVVGPSPLLAEVPVCYSPPLLAGFRCRWWWAVPATPGWGPLAAVVCGVWCVVCGGGVWVGLWLVCGVVGPSPLLAEVPVCYSPPLLAGFRFRWWWAVPATPGWGPLAALLCGVWCVAVVCWWGCGWCVVWLVPRHSWRRFLCATPRHSWLGFAAGGGGRSPPLLAGVRLRRWCVVCGVWCVAVVCWWGCGWCVVWLVPRHSWRRFLCATPRHSWLGFASGGGGRSPPLLAGVRWRRCCVVCGVWRWCVGGVVAGVWCGWSLATPGRGSCVLLPATPGWVSLPVVVGGPRHSWLGSACGGGVWCVAVVCWWGCGWCVVWLVPPHSWRRFLCATPRHSWLGFAAAGGGRSPPLLAGVLWRQWCVVCCWGPSPLLAEVPVCYSPPLLAGFRCRWWWAVPATPGWGPLAAVVCVFCLAGSGGPASRARCGAPHLFLWPLCLSALLGPLRAGVAPLSFAAVAVPRWLGFVVCGLAVAWHLFVCRGSLRVVRALRVCGTRRPSLLGTCPCALVVAGGVPLWRASWPRVVRRASSGPVALGAPVGFPDAVVPFPTPGACAPGFTGWLRGARGGRPRTGLIVPAAGPRRGRGAGLSASYPFGAPRWGCPWRVPPASVLGCVRCGGWRVWTRSLTRPVSRTVRLSTGDSAGAPGLFRVDADTSPCGSEDATPGSRACLRVLALLGRVGRPASRARSGAPHLFLWPLCLSALLGPLRAGVAPLFFAAVAFPRWLFFPASRCLARASFVSPAWPLAALWWLLPRPAPLCVSRFRRSCLWPWCFFFFFFFLRAPPLSPAFSGFRPRCPGPRRLRCLFCWPSASRLSVRLSLFRAFPLAVGCSRVVAAPPPPPFVSRGFRSCRSVLCAVLCCASPGAVRCCAALLRVVSPGVVLACAVLRSFGAAACCAVPSGAARRSGALCSAALCFAVFPRAVCSVCFVVARWCVLCVPCALRSVRCCASLCWCACVVLFVWCVLLLALGVVVRCCVLCCFLWCAVVRCWVWWPVVVCWWRVSVSVSLSGRVVCFPVLGVVCCGALLSCVVFCGAVLSHGAVLLCSAVVLRCCRGLLCPPVGCRAVLLVGCAVFGPVVVSACCGALFLALCVPCLLRSVRCGALLCWLWCPASLCRVLCRCAVVWCCAVVPCCRFAVLFVFALPSCGLSCGACVVCAVVGASCCGVSLCVVVSPWAFCGVVVLLWCVVVSCCAVRCPVVSCALCRVLRCSAVLRCCAGWLCCAVVCAAGVCFVLFSFAKNPCRFSVPLKTLFFFFFFFENKIKLYTTQHTRVQQDHVRGCALRVTRRS